MSIVLDRVVIRGTTFRVPALIYEYDQTTPLDPDSHAIRLLKPDDTQEGVAMTSPTKNDVGDYHQDVDTPATAEEGEWKVEWEITVLGKTSAERIPFRMVT